MKSEFVNCPACGMRNFRDDKKCGVCNHNLKTAPPPYTTKAKTDSNSIKNYLILALVTIAVICIAYNILHEKNNQDYVSNANKSNLTRSDYDLIKVDMNNNAKFSAYVRIFRKLTNGELEIIAKQVKQDIDTKSNTGSIAFNLPEMLPGNGSWAAVDFSPDPQARIIGQSLEDERQIIAGLDSIDDFVGLWSDNFKQGAVINRIRKDKKGIFFIEWISPINPKPSEFADRLKKITKKGKTTYIQLDDSGQYFLVEDNGNLSVYDHDGYVCTYQKLR